MKNWTLYATLASLILLSGCAQPPALCKYPAPPPELMVPPPPPGSFRQNLDRISGQPSPEKPTAPTD